MESVIATLIQKLLGSDAGTFVMVLLIVGVSIVSKYFEDKAGKKKAGSAPAKTPPTTATPPVIPENWQESVFQDDEDADDEAEISVYAPPPHIAPTVAPTAKPTAAQTALLHQYQDFLKEHTVARPIAPQRTAPTTPIAPKVASVAPVPAFNSQSVAQGIAWQVILGSPRCKSPWQK